MKEDTFTRSEADAAHVAYHLGRNQAISDHHEPVTTPFCSTCQGGTKAYACGPCLRDACTCYLSGANGLRSDCAAHGRWGGAA